MVFGEGDRLGDIVARGGRKSTLEAWFDANRGIPEGRLISYHDFPTRYVFDVKKREWSPRQFHRGVGETIGRMYMVHPRDSERFHLRLLLLHSAGAQSFEDLRRGDDWCGVSYL